MPTRRRTLIRHRTHWSKWGFTLIEMMLIVLVIGILSALAAPGLGGFLDAAKVNQTVTALRVSLQETQRQAIRKNQSCAFVISQQTDQYGNTKNAATISVQGDCLASGTPKISEDIGVATNLAPIVSPSTSSPGHHHHSIPSNESTNQVREITFGALGAAEFAVESSTPSPTDPSGKLVAFVPNKDSVQKKCVAVSSTLGLTRIGTYTGSTEPTEITDNGICTALDWKDQ